MQKLLVSVVMITYGHEDYIIEAIKGVLMQEFDGDIELIIANDKSPDNTDEICEKYFSSIELSSNISIRYTRHVENKGVIPNFVWALKQAKGEYIAICEGDDYWIDPLKIQKQVDFLKSHEEYSACISDRVFYYQDEKKEEYSRYPKIITNDMILFGEVLPTQCVLFRNILKFEQFSKFDGHPAGDRILSYLITLVAPVYNIGDVTSVYRLTGRGAWSQFRDLNQNVINAKSLKDFHDLVGLKRGNKFIKNRLYLVFDDMLRKNNDLDLVEFMKMFNVNYWLLLRFYIHFFRTKYL